MEHESKTYIGYAMACGSLADGYTTTMQGAAGLGQKTCCGYANEHASAESNATMVISWNTGRLQHRVFAPDCDALAALSGCIAGRIAPGKRGPPQPVPRSGLER